MHLGSGVHVSNPLSTYASGTALVAYILPYRGISSLSNLPPCDIFISRYSIDESTDKNIATCFEKSLAMGFPSSHCGPKPEAKRFDEYLHAQALCPSHPQLLRQHSLESRMCLPSLGYRCIGKCTLS